MNENRAIIFDIVRNSFVGGPGIRTTVFFKGCNLKCELNCPNDARKIRGNEMTVDEVFAEIKRILRNAWIS